MRRLKIESLIIPPERSEGEWRDLVEIIEIYYTNRILLVTTITALISLKILQPLDYQ